MLKVLDLFSGIGGFSLGLERTGGFETVAFCEIEPFPRRVLAKHWPEVPIFQDVRKLTGADIGPVDVICGGYPCQPFSTAGKRQGAADDRHLWPEFMRLVAELRPAWVIGENVAGHISMGLDDVLADLEAEGYACRTFVIPACAVGASHRRDRVWTLAHSAPAISERAGDTRLGRFGLADLSSNVADAQGERRGKARQHSERPAQRTSGCCEVVADTNNAGLQGRQEAGNAESERQGRDEQPERCGHNARPARRAQSRLGGMADGFSCWLDEPGSRVKAGVKDRAARLKALGNAVHPDIPMMIGATILEAEAAA